MLTLIRWIVIYPVDSVIQPLNNWGLKFGLQNILDARELIRFKTKLKFENDNICRQTFSEFVLLMASTEVEIMFR